MNHPILFLERTIERAIAHRKEVALGLALVVVSVGSVGIYYWYKDFTARQAHKAYTQASALQNARVLTGDEIASVFETVFTSEEEKWNAVARAYETVYKHYNNSGIGVMAGAAQAHALVKLGKTDEAKKLLADVMVRIPSIPLRSLYTLTYGRVLMDSSDEAEVSKGITLLSQLAATKDNAMHDTALYYLGLHYWYAGDMKLAQNYWKQLVMAYGEMGKNGSPWLAGVKEKLALLASDDTQDAE